MLTGSLSTAGNCYIVTPPSGTPAPLFGDTTATGNRSMNVLAGGSGIANYYDIVGAVEFRATDLENFGLWQGMFDAYKFKKITLNMEFLSNATAIQGTGILPTVYMYWDQDDATIPPTLSSITAKSGVTRRQIGNRMKTNFKTSFVPTVQTGLAQPGSVIGAGVQKAPWIDCVSSTIPHYALKFAITDVYLPGTTAQATNIRFNWTYDMAFRAPIACV